MTTAGRWLKFRRAEEHLKRLNDEIDAFTAPSNRQPIDAVASLRFYLGDGAVRLRTQKLRDFAVKCLQMFVCTGELCPWIAQ